MRLMRIGRGLDSLEQDKGMTVLSGINSKRVFASMLSVVMFAWLSMAAAPCEIALVSQAPGPAEFSSLSLWDDCAHAKSMQSIAGSDCCCSLTTNARVDAPKPLKAAMVILIASDPGFVVPAISVEPTAKPVRSSVDQASPPIYLATQRLRI
jgi:hypothetical protein